MAYYWKDSSYHEAIVTNVAQPIPKLGVEKERKLSWSKYDKADAKILADYPQLLDAKRNPHGKAGTHCGVQAETKQHTHAHKRLATVEKI